MSIGSTPRRASALALAASAALSLPATASAMPIDPPTVRPAAHRISAQTPGDGPTFAIPLAGGALALIVAGGGFVASRGSRRRPVSRVHAKT